MIVMIVNDKKETKWYQNTIQEIWKNMEHHQIASNFQHPNNLLPQNSHNRLDSKPHP